MTEQVIEDKNVEDVLLVDDEKTEDKVESTETLLSDDKGDGDKKEEDSPADEPKGAPEKYEDFNVPEGMELDTELLEEALPVFKELDLDQTKAQKLIDLHETFAKKAVAAQEEAWQTTMTEWKDQAKNDKEFGGQTFDASLATAKAAIDTFGNKEFKQMLEVTGIGNHPEMIRFLVKAGKPLQEHDIVESSTKGGSAKEITDLMYPTMVSDS